MMHLTRKDIEDSERVFRLNLINSISGIKPGNLIGTKGENGVENLAPFSSVVHLGSSPPLMGFIARPENGVPRHTLENIKKTQTFTINHIHESFIEKAHFTSAKFEEKESEFDHCGLNSEYISSFNAPFVKESTLKIGLSLQQILPIMNGTSLFVGQIEHLVIPENILSENGYLDLSKCGDVGVSGLNTYYRLTKLYSLPFARVTNLPEFSHSDSSKE